MDLKEFEKIIKEEPQEVAADDVKQALQAAEEPTEEPAEDPAEDPAGDPAGEPEQVTVNMLQFGQLATSLYCGLSDTIYKKVKKCNNAPQWEQETKEALQKAIEAVLCQYNVQMTPTTQLIAVVAAVEFTRYTLKTPPADENK